MRNKLLWIVDYILSTKDLSESTMRYIRPYVTKSVANEIYFIPSFTEATTEFFVCNGTNAFAVFFFQ